MVYTGLRDLGVLMKVQYGHGAHTLQGHSGRSNMSRRELEDEEIRLLEEELGLEETKHPLRLDA